jgi:hypothetical protein
LSSSNKSATCTPLGSLNVNHSNIHLSQITVDTAHIAKSASHKTLLDEDGDYFVTKTKGNPTLDQLNLLKEKAFTTSAYPKGIKPLTTLSYPQPNEDRSQSSDDEEDEASSSGSGPNDSGSSSDEESYQTDSDLESDSESSCDNPKSKKRSKAKAKSKYTHSKKSNKPKKSKAKQPRKKYTLKNNPKKTTTKLEVNVAIDLGKTAEEGDLYWQRVSNDFARRMVSNSGGDFVFNVKYQNIIDELEPEDIGKFDFWLANITQVSHQKKLHNHTVVGMRQHCCISALQDLVMEGEQHAPDQFNHMDRHYERHLDDIGAPREIWMCLSEHHKKRSKWFAEQKLKAAREYRKDLVNKAAPPLVL